MTPTLYIRLPIATLLAALAVLVRLAIPAAAEEGDVELVLIAHPDFPLEEVSLKRLDRLYLGRTKGIGKVKKATGTHAPIDSDLYRAFTRKVHHMTVPDLRRYWAKEVIMGRRVPPRQFDSFGAMLKFIAETPLAIGYAPANKRLVGVKRLKVDGKGRF